ncbi:MerR family transcriptional regulator [Cyanobium sp. FACHB-13342]|uniref:MerR family transcriptional regulator n=1 Tax=Cyanobium sp. FACHB-13342 TaxID=2692793 RepID=UPI0016815031|nr:MerR family transcriptional regulator [Cyanobium sp. FACHB-13342]MBD2421892.1 MerR family transcriptional regulator [Cyanobium sp. FACHB-13342]
MADLPAAAPVPSPVYGLEELLALAGERLGEEVTPRTVRLYATEGLIDRPGKDGRRAVYGQRQLLQLLLVRTLARRGLSLTAIAPLLAAGNSELERQLAQLEEPPATNAALDYLQELQSAPPLQSPPDLDLLEVLGAPICQSAPFEEPSRRLSPRSGGRSSSRWHRLALAPGVELHLSDSASLPPPGSRREAWLQRLLDRLRDHLDDLS